MGGAERVAEIFGRAAHAVRTRGAPWLSSITLAACAAHPAPDAPVTAVDSMRGASNEPRADQPDRTQQKASKEHLYVQGRRLYDRCGEELILRGINEMVIWTAPEGQTFGEIAKTGANSVRVVWTIADHPGEAQLDRVLERAIKQRLIPIIELHDATGKLAEVPRLVEFWLRPEIIAVLKKHERSLILNIANEAGGEERVDEFVSVYRDAIQKLRATGLGLPLMIDAPRWGQDSDTLQAAAPRLIEADPERNVLLSVHMWWAQGPTTGDPGSTRRIKTEIEQWVAMDLPLVIGEFAHAGVGCARSIDYSTILSEAQAAGVGWLAWSWGPGNKDCAEMDMTTAGTFETLQGWGLDVAVKHPASIQKTSRIPDSMLRGECAPHFE